MLCVCYALCLEYQPYFSFPQSKQNRDIDLKPDQKKCRFWIFVLLPHLLRVSGVEVGKLGKGPKNKYLGLFK